MPVTEYPYAKKQNKHSVVQFHILKSFRQDLSENDVAVTNL